MYNKRRGFYMIIYCTKNLINNKKYIGKDSNNNSNYLGSGTMFLEDIKKYGKENFKKEIIEYCKNIKELEEREIYWIRFFNAVESDEFYNLTEISGGWNFDKLGEEKYNFIKSKISNNSKGIKKPTLHDNQERKDKLSKANKGKPKPEGFGKIISEIKLAQNIKYTKEHCDKISKAKKNHSCYQTDSFKEKHSKPIIQLDKEENIINEFKSIDEAANSNDKFKRSNISCCLTGFSKTAYGFKWKYK